MKCSSIEEGIRKKIDEMVESVQHEVKEAIYQTISSFDREIKKSITDQIERIKMTLGSQRLKKA